MNDPEGIVFDLVEGIAVMRLAGTFALRDGVHRIRDAIASAHQRRLSRLMIVITETSGYGVPSLSMRLAMMREWADAADGFVRAVIVCRPELIDPHKFGITMAANFGMQAEVFANEHDAMCWLRQFDDVP